MEQDPDVTELLHAYADGDDEALGELFGLVYRELQRIARSQRRRVGAGPTLDTVALVNECYMRLEKGGGRAPENRAHFFAIASRAMRHLLVDYARSRARLKRCGVQAGIDPDQIAIDHQTETVLAVHQALDLLEAEDPRLVQVVECRYFAGLSVRETAVALDLSVSSVERAWRATRAFLGRELSG